MPEGGAAAPSEGCRACRPYALSARARDGRSRRPTQLSFGKVFTDHMFMLDYAPERGWHDRGWLPYQSLTLDPASCVLHYAQAIFDGMKAFRGGDGVVRLFRRMRMRRG